MSTVKNLSSKRIPETVGGEARKMGKKEGGDKVSLNCHAVVSGRPAGRFVQKTRLSFSATRVASSELVSQPRPAQQFLLEWAEHRGIHNTDVFIGPKRVGKCGSATKIGFSQAGKSTYVN